MSKGKVKRLSDSIVNVMKTADEVFVVFNKQYFFLLKEDDTIEDLILEVCCDCSEMEIIIRNIGISCVRGEEERYFEFSAAYVKNVNKKIRRIFSIQFKQFEMRNIHFLKESMKSYVYQK